MGDDPRSTRPILRAGLAVVAFAWLALFATLVWRSTETWIQVEPTVAQRLLDLLHEQRSLAREWEGAQRGDARFELDTEIRAVTSLIEDLESRARHPYRIHGFAPWRHLVPVVASLFAAAAAILVETLLVIAMALAVVSSLNRLAPRPRFAVLVALLAPLGLPPPLLAAAVADLGGVVGLPPSTMLGAVASLVAGLPPAILVLLLVGPRRPDAEIAAARDLGLTPTTVLRRILLPPQAPALTFAGVVVALRLFGDLAVARLSGGTTAPVHFGEWMRHRVVAAIDFPGAAAGAVAATLSVVAVAALFALAAARLAPGTDRAASPPRPRPRALPRADAGLARAVVLSALPVALTLALVSRGLADPTPLPALDARFVETVLEIVRAVLAAGLALAMAIAVAVLVDRACVGFAAPARAALVVLVATAMPAPVIGLALRILAGDLGLPVGPGLAVLAQALTALGPVAAFFLMRRPAHRDDGETLPLRHAVGPLVPVAGVLAFAVTLAAGDLGTILGLVDRTAVLRPPPVGVADSAALVAVVAAIVVGAWAARILEITRGRGLDP